MKTNYKYLQDSAFLSMVDNLQIKEQYVKITVLDWLENPLQEVQGLITGGSGNLDGKSAMRRSCNLTVHIPNEEVSNVTNINNLFSVNKKPKILSSGSSKNFKREFSEDSFNFSAPFII